MIKILQINKFAAYFSLLYRETGQDVDSASNGAKRLESI